jgi:hypothetical protein
VDIVAHLDQYESWLDASIPTDPIGRIEKHERMHANPFAFLRATYPRWLSQWHSDGADGPPVLSVGDAHIENFGTWRDAEGRLAWGVNDFDEAAVLSYTQDLVRVITSAMLAVAEGHLALAHHEIARLVADGYRDALTGGGAPVILGVAHAPIPAGRHGGFGDPAAFAAAIDQLPDATPSDALRDRFARALPPNASIIRYATRRAGLGSRDHQRVVAIANWRGGLVIREAKALAPPATSFLDGSDAAIGVDSARAAADAIRAPDPHYTVDDGWLVRRLASDCGRIELTSLPRPRDEHDLLTATGRELANIHLPTADRHAIRTHLDTHGAAALADAARRMLDRVAGDYRAYATETAKRP